MNRKVGLIFLLSVVVIGVFLYFGGKNNDVFNEYLLESKNAEDQSSYPHDKERNPASNRGDLKADAPQFSKRDESPSIKKRNYVEREKLPRPYIPKTQKMKLPSRSIISSDHTIEYEEKSYSLVENLFAIPKSGYIPQSYKIIQELGGVYIVEIPEGEYPPEDALRTVSIDGTNRYGVVTGLLTVKFQSAESFLGAQLIDDLSIKIGIDLSLETRYERTLANIFIGFYYFDNYDACVLAYNYLNDHKEEYSLSRIKIEIIEYQRSAN